MIHTLDDISIEIYLFYCAQVGKTTFSVSSTEAVVDVPKMPDIIS